MFAAWNDAFARIKRCALLQTRSVRHIRDGRAGTQLRAYVAHRRADVDQQPPRWSIGLLTRRFSVILERLGRVGVIQISTLVHYQRGGGGPRAGGGQGSGRARANARISSGGGQRGGGGPASYTTFFSRVPFPFAIDLMPNTLVVIVIKTSIVNALPIMLSRRGWQSFRS